MSLPREVPTYWSATAKTPDFPPLEGDVSADVAIVGGGIVGITAARALKDLGLRVVVVEALRVGRQVTGMSTAKVTSQHKTLYRTLVEKFDAQRARLYAEAQQAGLRQIERYVADHGLDCDLEPKPAYAYTCDQRFVEQIEQEADVALELGLPARLVTATDLPFDVIAAVRFDGQAQFHPVRYVCGLAGTLPGEGCHVFERSRVIDWQPDRVITDRGTVAARHVVMATHLPLGQLGGYYAEAYPYAEPVVAARIHEPVDGMYINVEEPSRSLRTHSAADGALYAIAAGTGFKPGHVDEERHHFDELERWLGETFDAEPAAHRWVNHDYVSMDRAPFVGWSSTAAERYLVATGFAAWGITNGTAAGTMLAELAAGRDHPWLRMFDAARVKPLAGGAKFALENLEVAGHLAKGYLSRKLDSVEKLARGEAAIVKIEGDNVAAFRDEQGCIHAVSAVCSHMGCLVGWNETDRTWDCPCHGSRFDLDGEVIHGPATRPLGSRITG